MTAQKPEAGSPDEKWMALALEQAREAEMSGDVPVGAVIVSGDSLIASGRNRTIFDCDPTAHAEIVAIRQAAQVLGNHRLAGTTLYVTLEPCAMCIGAIVQARIEEVVFGTPDHRWGCLGSRIDLGAPELFNHAFQVRKGVLAEDCQNILQAFFRARRR